MRLRPNPVEVFAGQGVVAGSDGSLGVVPKSRRLSRVSFIMLMCDGLFVKSVAAVIGQIVLRRIEAAKLSDEPLIGDDAQGVLGEFRMTAPPRSVGESMRQRNDAFRRHLHRDAAQRRGDRKSKCRSRTLASTRPTLSNMRASLSSTAAPACLCGR